jgi:hypothetical protein
MNIMNEFNDLINLLANEDNRWEGDLVDLADDAKDEICYHWLRLHPTWLDEIFPHTVSDEALFVLDLTYGVGMFEDVSNVALSTVFVTAHLRQMKDCDGDAFWSEALGNFEDILDLDNFHEEIRERIYMYLESPLRDKVQDIFDGNLLAASQGANLH